ncbi:MAG: type II toxin-antitoxin system Phd/YefM family antitoxin [bacterium]|nr:type II toxin-antitoxin system Phd/YefM family antitoxin [bacterium]
MNIKTTISISEARKKIFNIAEEVQNPGVYYTLTEKGRPKAVMMGAEEYESLVETLDVMRECPDILDRVAETKKAFKTGEYKKWPTLEDLKRDWGFAVAEKPKKKYGIQSNTRKTSKKRIK